MPPKFPSPYLNDTKESDSIMQRVPMDNMGIGARKSGMPKSSSSEGMTVDHVGGTAGSRK